MSEDGYGKIVGRIKDMIIRGGENIFPVDLEEFYSTHPDILEVQVTLTYNHIKKPYINFEYLWLLIVLGYRVTR